ncbi:MAG: hypothetical protein J6R91_06895 [Bacteroidaceae bacterium]|nr:hypothetical protein [Bacteroidaceae bacterium]
MDIKSMIECGNLDDALEALNKNEVAINDAERFYLFGRIYLKQNQWKKATDCFLQAQMLEPDGPAGQQLEMINSIMDFFNKDLYNQ